MEDYADHISEQPSILSLQRANVAGLGLVNVNLADCRFSGAHNLDQLRLEADIAFGLSPARAGWERRNVLAEECSWRANHHSRANRWTNPWWPDWADDRPTPLTPEAIAALYRALRKGREDAKDEPGAAAFYYGEMEMRRHARGRANSPAGGSRGRADRSVLAVYWLVAGYGLRAWRAVAWLIGINSVFALAFYLFGFSFPPQPRSYWTSLVYAFGSAISLTDNAVKLTAWGQLLQGLLRLTGPVLLGLALLALRGRVRRQGSGGIRKGTRGAQRRPGAGGPSGKLEGFCLAGDPRRRRDWPRTRSSRSPRRRGLGPRRSLAPRQDECRSAGRRTPELPGSKTRGGRGRAPKARRARTTRHGVRIPAKRPGDAAGRDPDDQERCHPADELEQPGGGDAPSTARAAPSWFSCGAWLAGR
jgi:hypothetical protein